MGAYKINVMLHDMEVQEFVRHALTIDWTSLETEELAIIQATARYVAGRFVDSVPELNPRDIPEEPADV